MSVIATALRHLIAAGLAGEELVAAVAEMEAALPAADAVAERRRAYDRERRRAERRRDPGDGDAPETPESGESADSADTPSLIKKVPPGPPSKKLTLPRGGMAGARPADPFPRPEGIHPDHWRDFLINRRRRQLANTASAHARLLHDLDRLADDEWPPGRLLAHAAAAGWGGIYDPREEEDSHGHRTNRTRHHARGDQHRAAAGSTAQAVLAARSRLGLDG